jgi:large subunit ribosomal protein L6
MSRIGKRPIKIEEDVKIEITGSRVTATFGETKLECPVPSCITVKEEGGNLIVERKDESKESRSLHGLTARLLKSIIIGVKEGFSKELHFTGTGYRIAVENKEVVLNVGYSHEIKLTIPDGVSIVVKKNTILISGADKQAVGQIAAEIRNVRPPEVYKGKGIKYKDEIIHRKAGKKAAS